MATTRLHPLARQVVGLLLSAPLLLQAGGRAQAEERSPWAGTVELYGFAPWVNLNTTVRGFDVTTELTPVQVINGLQFAASGRASVERERWGVMLDASYNSLGAEGSTSTPRGRLQGSAQVSSINGLTDLAVRYRFGTRESTTGAPGRWWLIPYAGLRVVQARLDVNAQLEGRGPLGLRVERDRTLERTWTQPLIGTQASVFLTPGLRAFARGDVGGFGLAGDRDLSGNVQAGLGIALGNTTELTASWRYLGLAWSDGAERSTGFTSDQSGVELGLRVLF